MHKRDLLSIGAMPDAQVDLAVARAVVTELKLSRFCLDALGQGQCKVCFEFGRFVCVFSIVNKLRPQNLADDSDSFGQTKISYFCCS